MNLNNSNRRQYFDNYRMAIYINRRLDQQCWQMYHWDKQPNNSRCIDKQMCSNWYRRQSMNKFYKSTSTPNINLHLLLSYQQDTDLNIDLHINRYCLCKIDKLWHQCMLYRVNCMIGIVQQYYSSLRGKWISNRIDRDSGWLCNLDNYAH